MLSISMPPDTEHARSSRESCCSTGQHLQLLADLCGSNVRHQGEGLHALPKIHQQLLQLQHSLVEAAPRQL